MHDEAVRALLEKVEADKLYEIKEVAAILQLSTKVVYTMAVSGEIDAFRMRGRWKIHSLSLQKYIQNAWCAEPQDRRNA